MRWIGIALGLLALVAIVAGGGFYAASESGEVVVLHSRDATGVTHETRLWVVDDAGYAWLRTGNPESQWLARVRSQPDIEVERRGTPMPFRGVLVDTPETRDRINALVLEKYGWAERYLRALMLDPAAVTPVRLEPR